MCTQGRVPAPALSPDPQIHPELCCPTPRLSPLYVCFTQSRRDMCLPFHFCTRFGHLTTHPFLSLSSEYSTPRCGPSHFFSFSPLYGHVGDCQYFAVSLRQSVTLCICVLCCWDVFSGEGPGRGIAVPGRSRAWSVDKCCHMFLQKGSSSSLSMGRAGQCFPHCFTSPMCHLVFCPVN